MALCKEEKKYIEQTECKIGAQSMEENLETGEQKKRIYPTFEDINQSGSRKSDQHTQGPTDVGRSAPKKTKNMLDTGQKLGEERTKRRESFADALLED